jgi:hypothetical protein
VKGRLLELSVKALPFQQVMDGLNEGNSRQTFLCNQLPPSLDQMAQVSDIGHPLDYEKDRDVGQAIEQMIQLCSGGGQSIDDGEIKIGIDGFRIFAHDFSLYARIHMGERLIYRFG